MRRVVLPLLMIVALLLSGCSAAGKITIKSGLQGPMTGSMVEEGKGFQNALKLLVEQTNKAGGTSAQRAQAPQQEE